MTLYYFLQQKYIKFICMLQHVLPIWIFITFELGTIYLLMFCNIIGLICQVGSFVHLLSYSKKKIKTDNFYSKFNGENYFWRFIFWNSIFSQKSYQLLSHANQSTSLFFVFRCTIFIKLSSLSSSSSDEELSDFWTSA